jgi:hypothetical protein
LVAYFLIHRGSPLWLPGDYSDAAQKKSDNHERHENHERKKVWGREIGFWRNNHSGSAGHENKVLCAVVLCS